MFVAVLTLELHLPASNSLKHKRMILNSLKGRMRNSFNVSIAEVGDHDKWQKTVLAVCQVNSDKAYLHKATEKVLRFVESFNGTDLIRNEMEIL